MSYIHRYNDNHYRPSENLNNLFEVSIRHPLSIDDINGLNYIENYINDHQHDWLLERIDQEDWLNDLKRRVQHYGYKYDYKATESKP